MSLRALPAVRGWLAATGRSDASAVDFPDRLNPCLRSPCMSTKQRSDPPAFTPLWEQRLIAAAKRGEHVAVTQLLDRYEPMVRRITGSLYLPGGEREDLAQEARLGILAAIRAWDPNRSVPFRCFAWLCAVREARMAVGAARAAKHQPLNRARSLHTPIAEDGVPLQDTLVAIGHPTTTPWPRRSAANGCRPSSRAHARSPSSSAARSRCRLTTTGTATARGCSGWGSGP
jgi:hypothetical protein